MEWHELDESAVAPKAPVPKPKRLSLTEWFDNVKLKFVISSEARNLPKFGAP
jgi:hypothetical protein